MIFLRYTINQFISWYISQLVCLTVCLSICQFISQSVNQIKNSVSQLARHSISSFKFYPISSFFYQDCFVLNACSWEMKTCQKSNRMQTGSQLHQHLEFMVRQAHNTSIRCMYSTKIYGMFCLQYVIIPINHMIMFCHHLTTYNKVTVYRSIRRTAKKHSHSHCHRSQHSDFLIILLVIDRVNRNYLQSNNYELQKFVLFDVIYCRCCMHLLYCNMIATALCFPHWLFHDILPKLLIILLWIL